MTEVDFTKALHDMREAVGMPGPAHGRALGV